MVLVLLVVVLLRASVLEAEIPLMVDSVICRYDQEVPI